MNVVEHRRGNVLMSTDKAKLQPVIIQEFLSTESYWAQGRPMSVVKTSIQNSLCFGIYSGSKQIGFARVVTDYATFAWLCDVFIVTHHRGQGLAKWLIESVVAHPDLQGIKRFMLATSDAHELYSRYGGFCELDETEKWMERRNEL